MSAFARNNMLLMSALVLAGAIVFPSVGAAQLTNKTEDELIGILQGDAPLSEKALACKHLSVKGSSKAVPVLAPLLADSKLASWARIALEVIPGAAADEALRNAAESLQGRLLVGVLHSIGVRRDAAAVDLLTTRLQDKDVEVASAAALALGRIGNEAATQVLRKALSGEPKQARDTVAEGCILCAERALAQGRAADAVAIYDEVRLGDVPYQRVLDATRGAILARGTEGVPLLVEQLRSPNKGMFQIGLSTARELPGRDVDHALAAELARAPLDRAVLLIAAMADRPETVELPAVMNAAAQGPKPVRLAALTALGKIGDASCLTLLLDVALEADAELTDAAKKSLAELPPSVDPEIAARLAQAKGKSYPLLIELVGLRRIEATAALVKALDHSDKAVRGAALAALGETVSQQGLSVLITQVVSPKSADDAAAAQKALKAAAVRMPDREACAAELSAALERAPAAARPVLLDIIAQVGGTKALQTVGAAARGSDPQLQDVASQLLGKWMTPDAAPVLLELAKTGPVNFQVRALRGYIRIARQMDLPDAQRVAMLRTAFESARQPAEKKVVLEVLKTRPKPSVDMLRLAVDALQSPDVKEDAIQAVEAIAQKLEKTDEVKALLAKAGLSQ
jgi:HEAT repeat protein